MLSFNRLYQRYQSLIKINLHKFCVEFAHSTPKVTPDQKNEEGLSIIQQKALISYAALNFLMKFPSSKFKDSSLSLRENLVNRTIFRKFINETYGYQLQDILKDECFDQVLSGFQISTGALYNELVFSQSRFKMAEKNKMIQDVSKLKDQDLKPRIILNPLSYTGKIIRKIISQRAAIISGEKGTGKSFSYLTYTYLYQYIDKLRSSQGYSYSNPPIFSWISRVRFQRLPKINYFTIKQLNSYQDIIEILEQQNQKMKDIQKIPIQVQFGGEKSIGLFKLKKYLQQIKNKDRLHGYKYRGIVVDEANYYYSLLRKLVRGESAEDQRKSQAQMKDYLINTKAKAYFISNVLTQTNSFNPNIQNSSQSVERKFVTEYNSTSDIKFYNFFQNQRSINLEFKIELKSYLNKKEGQIQLYGIFWFIMECKMQLNGVSQQLINSYRKIFIKTFGIPNQFQEQKQSSSNQSISTNQQKGQKQLSEWSNDVRFYNIRLVFDKISYKQIISIFSANDASNQLMKLRKKIQKNRSQLSDEFFDKFFDKSAEFQKYDRRKFLWYISGLLQNILNDETKNNNDRVQLFIPYSEGFSQNFRQQIRQSLDIFIKEEQQKGGFTCVIYKNPFELSQKINSSLEKLLKTLINLEKELMQKGGYNPGTIGSNFELLLGVLISNGKIRLNFQQFNIEETEKGKRISFDIFDVARIGQKKKNELTYENSMKNFYQKMENNPGKYIGGLPMKENNQNNQNNSFFFFDFAIGKFTKSTQDNKKPSLQIRIIDYTFGSISKKSTNKTNDVNRFMKGLKDYFATKCAITIIFHVASPIEYVKKYIQHLQRKMFAQKKYNFYNLPEHSATKFQAVLLGIPDTTQLIKFEEDYIYRISKRSAQKFLIDYQQLISGMVNSVSHNKNRTP